MPSGHSSPCIWDDHIFLTGYAKDKKQLSVFCIERASGNIRWSRPVSAEQIEKVHTVSSPAAATPASDGERVYAYFGSCGLLCYDFAGQLQWTVPLPIPKATGGLAASPAISGDSVVLNIDAVDTPYLLAVDRRTGKTVWKQPQPVKAWYGATGHCTPVVWGEQLVVHRSGEIAAHSIKDGTRLWWIAGNTTGVSTPVVGRNVLFVGTWNHSGEADQRVELPDFQTLVGKYDKDNDARISKSEFPDDLAFSRRPEVEGIEGADVLVKQFFGQGDQNQDGSIDTTEWKAVLEYVAATSFGIEHGLFAIKPGGENDVTTTHILWREQTSVPEVPSPLYCNGRVYMVRNGGIVSCMDGETGKLLYRERLGAAGPYYSSPIYANGNIYVASGKGVVTVFAAADHMQILAKNNLNEPVFATPAVVDSKLYIRTIGHLYAFGK